MIESIDTRVEELTVDEPPMPGMAYLMVKKFLAQATADRQSLLRFKLRRIHDRILPQMGHGVYGATKEWERRQLRNEVRVLPATAKD